MSRVRRADLLFYAGAECYEKYGVLSRLTHPSEDVPETFTRTGTAYYIDRNGVLRIAEANALRTEWTGAAFDTPNLLLEDARTNGWTFSEQLDNAAWAKTRCTISANAVVAPDGATTADKIVEDTTAANDHRAHRNTPTLTDNTNQAFSFFAKAAERTWLGVRTINKANRDDQTWVNLSTGALGTTDPDHTIAVKALPNGWYYITCVFGSQSGATTPDVFFHLAEADNDNVYTGDGSSGLYVWGVQFETDKPFASSYIKTLGSTVTRTAETLFFPFVAPPQEMTVYAKFIESGQVANTSSDAVVFIGDAQFDTDPRFFLAIGNTGFYGILHDNGTTVPTVVLASAPGIGDTVELRGVLNADGSVLIGQSINSGAETTASDATTATLGSAWANTRIYLNSLGTFNRGHNKHLAHKVARGTKTMEEMRAAAA